MCDRTQLICSYLHIDPATGGYPTTGRYNYVQQRQTQTTTPRPVAAGEPLRFSGASGLYSTLGVLLLAAAILALIGPYRLSDWFFRGHLKHTDVLYEELWRILAGVFLMAAIVCYALKSASDRHMMGDPVVQRLQLGFFWFALMAIILHLVHLLFVKSLTFWGLILGAVIMAPTLLLPTAHLSMSGGFGLDAMSDGFTACFNNLFFPRQFTVLSILYSLLTVLFTLVGILYLFAPRPTLQWVFGYNVGTSSLFLWQWIGSGLLFLFPAVTYTCQEHSIHNLLGATIPRSLNVGLVTASLFHILEFGTLLLSEGVRKRWLLVALVIHWGLVLLTAIGGLSVPEDHAGAAYEYEALPPSAAVGP